MYRKYFKYFLDLFIILLFLPIVIPAMLILTPLVYFYLGSPIIFKQKRPGVHGKPFVILKFRTMRDIRDANGNLLPDNQRLTKFGRFLRNFSLDEFPELINVVKGDMSLVGPRPLLMEYLQRYSHEQARRHDVKPGITGWVQVNGRNGLSWKEKFELDVWYVKNQSFWLDIKILWRTLVKMLAREGINQSAFKTMEIFMGCDQDE